ncbi:MAG: peptidoglycan DD-metalloendopeptidase family protein [Proteobacteria bacterium]|nr:peptidoglycan DD-metalloendopeptidase family protein [Pseudomonadota bacterium]
MISRKRRFPNPFHAAVAVAMSALVVAACSSGPFTRPARVVLYDERNRVNAAPPAAQASRAAPSQGSVTSVAQTELPPATPSSRYSGLHQVRSGETVYAVASDYRVPIRSVIELNNLQAPYVLRPGQTLRVPVSRDHIVQSGDTLYGISRTYGVAMNALVRLNDIPPPYTIVAGRSLRLPEPVQEDGTAASAPATAAETAGGRPEEAPSPSEESSGSVTGPSATPPPAQQAAVNPSVPMPPPRSGRTFLLPVRGKLISSFGSQGQGLHNDGVNIAAARGTPVRAAENGIVVYSGNALLGFGNMILIRHADGFMTAYAHNDTIDVKRGDTVRRGQAIATVGSTGSVSTPQLHFEVRKGKSAVDPAKYLPNLESG